MKIKYSMPLAVLAGIAMGAAAMQVLHAEAKPPIYVVSEIDVTNVDAYTKEYVPLARASIAKAGGKALAAGQNPTALEGPPQKSRITINVFNTLEDVQAWRNSSDYKDARKIADKYATFRAFAVEGLPQ